MSTWYACPASIGLHDARCHNQKGYCPAHKGNYNKAPAPEIVLFRFTVNPTQGQYLEMAEIRRITVDRGVLEQEHVANAERVGRNAYVYDSGPRHVADAGVRVFGQDGASVACLYPAWEEMKAAGYKVVDVQLMANRAGHMDILTIAVSNLCKEHRFLPSLAAEGRLTRILNSRWGYTHVWANPRVIDTYLLQELRVEEWATPQNPQGYMVHTINSLHRSDEKPSNNLHFAEGLWELRPTLVPQDVH